MTNLRDYLINHYRFFYILQSTGLWHSIYTNENGSYYSENATIATGYDLNWSIWVRGSPDAHRCGLN